MRIHSRWGILAVLTVAVLATAATTFAADPPTTNDLAHAGDYCIACHSANDPRLSSPLAWNGDRTREAYSPCPTIRQLRQEIFYVDDAIDAINHGIGTGDGAAVARVLAREESLPRLLEIPYASLGAGTNAARQVRYQLSKTYSQVQTARQAANLQVVFIVGIVVTAFLLGSLAWGLWNTRHLGSLWRGFRMSLGSLIFVLVVFVLFALPLYNPPASGTDAATAQDAERQSALDSATRAAVSAEITSGQAWELARLAGSSANLRSLSITAALSATKELAANADAYWGSARAIEEAAIVWDKAPEAAPPVAQRIEVAAARVWTYAAMADELASTNPSQARDLLSTALARVPHESDSYFRDLDLKKIAVAFGPRNHDQALATANQIQDPFIRAWSLRELGVYDAAAASARQVKDDRLRVFALREIALASKNTNLLSEALAIAQSMPDPMRAYALADLAAAWSPLDASQAERVATSITPQFHGARASALRRSGLYALAWAETDKLAVGFEQARAQAELVGEWARVQPNDALAVIPQIRDIFWRAQAQRAVAAAVAPADPARAIDLARAIPLPFARVQALTDLGRFQEAAALAGDLHDSFAVRNLAVAWAAVEPAPALALVDQLDREADRAEALLAVAVALAPVDRIQANAVFDRAVKQAQAARMTGDPVYSVELLRQLGVKYAPVDAAKAGEAFSAALDAARKLPTGF